MRGGLPDADEPDDDELPDCEPDLLLDDELGFLCPAGVDQLHMLQRAWLTGDKRHAEIGQMHSAIIKLASCRQRGRWFSRMEGHGCQEA